MTLKIASLSRLICSRLSNEPASYCWLLLLLLDARSDDDDDDDVEDDDRGRSRSWRGVVVVLVKDDREHPDGVVDFPCVMNPVAVNMDDGVSIAMTANESSNGNDNDLIIYI